MAEHWCKEHQQVWFKKGKMKGYAHPIKEVSGEDTGEWCNEPETKEDKPKQTKPVRDTSTNASIEAQVAVKAITELRVAGLIDPNSQLAVTAENWIISKLQYWSSQGEEVTETGASTNEASDVPTEKMITEEQIERIKEVAKKYEWNLPAYTKLMKEAYGLTNYKKLNALQAEDLIKRLTEGEGLTKEPEDIPFQNKSHIKS